MPRTYVKLMLLFLIVAFGACAPAAKIPAAGKGDILKVMTYNVHHCNPPSKPGLIDIDAIAAVIKKENADIVALQEIDVNTGRSGKVNQAERLAVKAGYHSFFFARAIDFDGGQYGIAILSKYPLSKMKINPLPTEERTGGERRTLATATITLNSGKTFVFGSTHLDAQENSVNRLLQINEISKLTNSIKGPYIIAGDFNASEETDVINILDQNFIRTSNAGNVVSPDSSKEKVIDFIAYKPANTFSVLSHVTIQENYASDHLPVVAVLQLKF